ncbi:hypothetical protein TL16_g11342 [Triparma laevis f. inornata]|uniref:Dihydrolipoamide acetyltransferase component of pyruvate dehydrogenase complex n=1 Tax=Triparma laevis f. inornata TaxID=1714386 RepID=A0A9W7ET78_9STRA|nr:hypothetical protein TL16_g11342 [Triparma laevis f. inornata]
MSNFSENETQIQAKSNFPTHPHAHTSPYIHTAAMLRLTRNVVRPALHALTRRPAPSSLLSQRRFFSSDLPDHTVQGMPALSPTMEVGNISWRMKEGDEFVAGDVLAEIETDKASIDFVTEDDGFIGKLLVPDGAQEVPVGAPILVVVDSADDVAAFKDFVAEVGDTPASPPAAPPPAAPTYEPAAAAPVTAPPAAAAAAPSGSRVIASPKARKLALDLGVPLHLIPGTGEGGRILAADVQEYTPSAGSAGVVGGAPQAAGSAAAFNTIHTSSDLAALSVQSKREVPHYYLTVDISVASALKVRSSLNAGLGEEDSGISLYDFIIMSASRAMATVPSVNASWIEDGSGIRVYEECDVNLVIGSPGNCSTMLIPGAEKLGLGKIAEHTANPTPSSEVGTFSIVNLGMYGVKTGSPIIVQVREVGTRKKLSSKILTPLPPTHSLKPAV